MLACRAATRLIIPDTPTPLPPTATPIIPTLTPTIPPPTATPIFQAACPVLLSDIMKSATSEEKEPKAARNVEDEEELRYLVTYTLEDDRLSHRREIYIPENFDDDLDRRAAHEWIWDYFAALIPIEQRSFVTEFSAMSDGQNEILGGVSRAVEDFTDWELFVDVLDASDHYSLTYTLMHEFGHLVTLNSSQVAADKLVIFNPENENFYERAVARCSQYFPDDGCSTPNSYINEFFNRYWTGFYAEWQEIDKTKDEEEASYYGSLHRFYKHYEDQFLTEYSATSPEEDIAEAWAFFILAPKPDSISIANEKVLFFYEYPELVQTRQEILTRLCDAFPQ